MLSGKVELLGFLQKKLTDNSSIMWYYEEKYIIYT